MLGVLFALLAVALLIAGARTVAVYTSELFSSANEMLSSGIDLSDRRRRFLEEVVRRPHGLLLTASFLKSLALIASTGLTVVIAAHLRLFGGGVFAPTAVAAVGVFWLVFMMVEIMPPVGGSEGLQARLQMHLGVISVVYDLFSPLRRLAGMSWARYADERRDQEKKEEIVERAIESLAEGIGTQEPIIEQDERQMIQQIFRLDSTEVREIMVPRINVIAVEPDVTLEQLRRVIRDGGHSRIPVYEGDLDNILGVAYAKDVFCNEPPGPEAFDVRTFIHKPLVVPDTQKIGQLLDEFRRRHMHLAIVVDEYGGTAGIVSLEDIIEEIFGEIEDEHDRAGPTIVRQADGAILVSGQVPLEEVTEYFVLPPLSEDFETVGGLIYDLVGGVPPEGRVLVKPPLRFTVIHVDGQRIEKVLVERLTEDNV